MKGHAENLSTPLYLPTLMLFIKLVASLNRFFFLSIYLRVVDTLPCLTNIQ